MKINKILIPVFLIALCLGNFLLGETTVNPIFGPVKVDFSNQIWPAKPAPKTAKTVPHHARIVDYGDDWSHFRQDQFMSRGRVTTEKVDLDNDGKKDDTISGIKLSLDKPFLGYNLKDEFQERVDWEANNITIYGGRSYYLLDYYGQYFMEGGGPNMDHSSGADDLNFMIDSPGGTKLLRADGLWLWKKIDFYNLGNKYRVSFDNSSLIALHAPRHWTVGYGRFVVQDGKDWYISEFTFKGNSRTHQVKPAETRWSPYSPQAPWDIQFKKENAKFAKHQFQDIQFIGYYLTIDEYKAYTQNNGIKLGAFEVDAVVHKPITPSDNLAMVKVPAATVKIAGKDKTVDSFYLSSCPMPYTFHQKITRWSYSDCSVDGWGYIYDRTGDMGSMRLLSEDGSTVTHQPDEPVTGITWLDAVAWCNALSEFESKTPVYYADPEFKTVFKIPLERRLRDEFQKEYVPKVYLKKDAPGYRLPTIAEWIAAYQPGGKSTGESADPNSTHPVGAVKPDQLGLYDMTGNIWQWAWDYGISYNPTTPGFQERHVVLGGDFTGKDPRENPASPWGSFPIRGAYNIGFRVARNLPGKSLKTDSDLKLTSGVDLSGKKHGAPSWVLTKDDKTKPRGGEIKKDLLQMVKLKAGSYIREIRDAKISTYISQIQMGKTEIPFDAWERVRRWAVMHGYRFSFDGDMGSMWYRSQRDAHATNEPVTRISWWDTLVWCNALSEMAGRRPCYYQDKEYQEILRKSPLVQKFHDSGYSSRYPKKIKEKWGFKQGPPKDSLHVDWSTDGYRLPTKSEWEYATRAGTKGRYYWGNKADPEKFWARENSGCRTKPAATKPANPWGLHDLFGNVMEFSWSSEVDNVDITKNPKNGGAGQRTALTGGGFLHPAASNFFGIIWSNTEITRNILGYPEIGFRVVRCDKVPVIVIDNVKYTVEGDLVEKVAALKDKKVKLKGIRNQQLGTIRVTEIEELK